jgi:hypothetical protein
MWFLDKIDIWSNPEPIEQCSQNSLKLIVTSFLHFNHGQCNFSGVIPQNHMRYVYAVEESMGFGKNNNIHTTSSRRHT